MGYWYDYKYEQDNIAVSTRVRLARNIEGIPFPSKMNDEHKKVLFDNIKSAIKNINTFNLKFILLSDIPENERFALVERHIISKEFANNSKNRAIVISEDESIAIMIGEEDHIRIQVVKPGFCPEEAFKIANQIDDEISKNVKFSFDNQLGYLTECPSNLGTGIRVSAMLHLPLLEANGKIQNLIESLNKIGFTIRGMYGEGSKALSSFYQISNQITLGITEQNAIDNLISIKKQICDLEMAMRERIDKTKIEDRSSRALYTLKGAKILGSNEMMKLLSDVMIGQSLNLISENAVQPIKVLIESFPFMVMKKYGEKNPNERDIIRAKTVSESINLV